MIIYCIAGSLVGIMTGLIPGLHTNNITITLTLVPFIGPEMSLFVISMCVSQSFVDFIPSLFLGVPETSTFEGVLPGHKMALKGEAYKAICLTVFGGLIAIITGLMFLPFFIIFINANKEVMPIIVPVVLFFSIGVLILSEKKYKKVLASFVLFASATQGLFFVDQIFPLIIGYFGLPTVIYSLQKEKFYKKQKKESQFEFKMAIEGVIGMAGGAIVAIIPGIGSNLAAAIIKTFREKIKTQNYLTLVGSINTSNFFFSIPMLFFLSKARNGAMLFLNEKLFLTENLFYLSFIAIIIAAGIGGSATILISKKAIKIFSKKIINISEILSIILMVFLVFFFNNFIGIIAMSFSCALGLLAVYWKIKRSTCLGALIVPVLFFYLFVLI